MSLYTCPATYYQSCAPGYGLDANFDQSVIDALNAEFPGMAFSFSGDQDSLDDIDLVGMWDPNHPQNGIVWAPKREEWQMSTPVVAIETETKATPEPRCGFLVIMCVVWFFLGWWGASRD